MPPDKCIELLQRIKDLGSRPCIQVKQLRMIAGLAAWISDLLPQLRPFVTMIRAALNGAIGSTVLKRKAEAGLNWLCAFAEGQMRPMSVLHLAETSARRIVVVFDASTTGGGAILFTSVDNEGNDWQSLAPDNLLATRWNKTDEQLLSASIGSAADQAKWEAFILTEAVMHWKSLIAESTQPFWVIGDALGVLEAAAGRKSKDAIINALMAELALIFAPLGRALEATHIWSERNPFTACLRRISETLEQPAEIEPLLVDAKIEDRMVHPWRVLGSSRSSRRRCQLK